MERLLKIPILFAFCRIKPFRSILNSTWSKGAANVYVHLPLFCHATCTFKTLPVVKEVNILSFIKIWSLTLEFFGRMNPFYQFPRKSFWPLLHEDIWSIFFAFWKLNDQFFLSESLTISFRIKCLGHLQEQVRVPSVPPTSTIKTFIDVKVQIQGFIKIGSLAQQSIDNKQANVLIHVSLYIDFKR